MKGLRFAFFLVITAALVAAQVASDPFAGRLQKRAYTNDFFGLSFEVPKGLQTNLEMRERNKAQAEQWAQQDRQRGILISAAEFQTHIEPLSAPVGGAGDIRPDNPSGVSSAAQRIPPRLVRGMSLAIMPLPAQNPPASAKPVIEAQMARITATDPSVAVSGGPAAVTLGGQEFYRADYSSQMQVEKEKRAYTNAMFITLRQGYALAFTFNAEKPKDLQQMVAAMDTLKFAP